MPINIIYKYIMYGFHTRHLNAEKWENMLKLFLLKNPAGRERVISRLATTQPITNEL